MQQRQERVEHVLAQSGAFALCLSACARSADWRGCSDWRLRHKTGSVRRNDKRGSRVHGRNYTATTRTTNIPVPRVPSKRSSVSATPLTHIYHVSRTLAPYSNLAIHRHSMQLLGSSCIHSLWDPPGLFPASITCRSRAAPNTTTTALGADPSILRFMTQKVDPGSRRNPRLVLGREVRETDNIHDLARDLV